MTLDDATMTKIVAAAIIALMLYASQYTTLGKALDRFGHVEREAAQTLDKNQAEIDKGMQELATLVKL